MDLLSGTGAPWPASDRPPPPAPGEAADLAAVADELGLAPRAWVPAEAEAAFYRLNQLGPRLAAIFGNVDPRDPDEDDVEEAVPAARRLVAAHALLDTWVDAFYDAVEPLGPRLRVRRPGAGGVAALAGRPGLLALRAVWAEAWTEAAVLARLRDHGDAAVRPEPVMIHADVDLPAPAGLADRAAALLGGPREVRCDGDGRIVRIASATRRSRSAADG